jgi:hypothetical protein
LDSSRRLNGRYGSSLKRITFDTIPRQSEPRRA